MGAVEIRERLHKIADQIDSLFDQPDILPTLQAANKGIDALEKIVGYCNDKLTPTPLEDRASEERMQSRKERAKARKR